MLLLQQPKRISICAEKVFIGLYLELIIYKKNKKQKTKKQILKREILVIAYKLIYYNTSLKKRSKDYNTGNETSQENVQHRKT